MGSVTYVIFIMNLNLVNIDIFDQVYRTYLIYMC